MRSERRRVLDGGYASSMAWEQLRAARLFGLAVAVVFAVACGSGDKTIEERWEGLNVPEAEIVFLGDWTDEERAAITREVKSVQVAHAERFGEVTSEFTLYISTEFEALNAAYREWLAPEVRLRSLELPRWFTCDGWAWQETIFIALETCDDKYRAWGGSIAHEYFHILQYHLGLVGGSGDWWPSWLVEGAAVYATAHHAEEQGRWTLSWRRKAAQLEWSALGYCFPGVCNRGFERFQVRDPSLDSYSLAHDVGFLAVDWLVERKGEAALMQFFRLGGGRHEFEEAFGMTPEEFGAGMEELWREVAPPFEWRVSGRVLDPQGRPVAYAKVEPLVQVEDERIVLTGDRANSRGEFDFHAPDEGHTLGVFLKCPDDSTNYRVFVGEWGAEGFVADDDGRFESDAEGAEPLAGEEPRTGIVIELPETQETLLEKHCES